MLAMMGELFVGETVKYLAGPITASAAVVAVHILIVLYITALVVIFRKAPARWLGRLVADHPESILLPVFAAAASFWHLPALLLLLMIFHQVVTSGTDSFPVLFQLPIILLSLAATAYVIDRLNRTAKRGLRLSASIDSAMPNLRGQLDAFVPPFFRLLAWIVSLVWVGFTFQTLGLARPWSWIEARFGIDFASVIASLVIILLVAYAVWLSATTWIDYRLKPVGGHAPSARQQTLYSLLRNVVLVVILLTALAYALSSFGVSVAPLLASAGVVGLAISWGSQKLVQDVITGLFIQVENVFNVGDVVELGGRIGTVEKLTVRSVSLRDVEGVMHTIPFSSVDAVSNHMRGYSYHVADISVAYGADLDLAKDEMIAAYDDLADDFEWSTRLLGGVEWFGVQTLGPHSVTLRARLKTRPGEQWAVGRAYAERVKRRFDAAGIEIPFPQLRLWTESDRSPAAPSTAVTPAPKRAADSPTDADFDGGGAGEGSDR
jgi:small conductance mechanosensitive channel